MPTFGKTTTGASTSTSTGAKSVASPGSPASNGTLTAGHAYVWCSAAAKVAKMAIYADSSGAPGALLAVSDEVTLGTTAEAVVDFPFSGANQISLTGGSTYWIAVTWPSPGATITWRRDGTSSVVRQNSAYGANPYAASATLLSGPIAAWAEYTEPAGTVAPGTVFDLSRWHLTLPTDGPDSGTDADQVDQPALATYADANFTLDGSNRMVCTAPVSGATTSGESGATRSELREHEANYDLSAWDPTSTGRRECIVTMQVDPTGVSGGTNPRQESIVWQIHGTTGTPPIYLAAEWTSGGSPVTPRIRAFLSGSGLSNENLLSGITTSTKITIKCVVESAQVKLWVIAGEVADLPAGDASPTRTWNVSAFTDISAWYFKTGAYNKTDIASASSGQVVTKISYLSVTGPGSTPAVDPSVRGTSAANATNAASLAIAKPAGTAEHDLLICGHVADSDSTLASMAAPAGWTALDSGLAVSLGLNGKVWWKVAGPSEPASYTFTQNAGDTQLGMIAVADPDPDTPIAAFARSSNSSSSATHTAPSVAGVARGLLLCLFEAGRESDQTRTFTPPTGMTELVDANGTSRWVSLGIDGQSLTADGATGTRSSTCSDSCKSIAYSLVVAPKPAGTTVALGRAGESDIARGLSSSKATTLGRAAATSGARALTASKSAALGRPTETDWARPLGQQRSYPLGRAGETDSARPLGSARSTQLGRAAEADRTRALGSTRAQQLGRIGETSGTRPLVESRGLARIGEHDGARPLTAGKVYQLGRAGEQDRTRPVGPVTAVAFGRAGETSRVRALPAGAKEDELGQAVETSGARPVDFSRLHPLGRAGEQDRTRPVMFTRAQQLGRIAETSGARPLTARKTAALGRAAESDRARPIGITRTYQLGRVGEASGARALLAAQTATDQLNPSIWAVDPESGNLTPLPHFVKLSISPIRNSPSQIAVEYPVYGRNFGLLAAGVEGDRDVEVEIWLYGSRASARRGLLTDTAGDDVEEQATWSFTGTLLPQLLDEALVDAQAGNDKRELVFTSKSAGEIVATVLQQAQTRGVLVGVARDFTTTTDSRGTAWPEVATMSIAPTTSLLEVLGQLVDLGMVDGFDLAPNRVLHLWAPGGQGTDRTVGPAPTVLRGGRSITEAPRRHSVRKSGTAVLVAGKEGIYGWANDPSAQARRGRRIEVSGSAQQMGDEASVGVYATNYLQTITPGALEVTHGLAFGAGHPRPVVSFDVGDWVWSDTRGQLERLRVQQWSLIVEGGAPRGEIVLGTALADRLQALARQLKRLSSGAQVVGTSNPPAGPDTMAPAAPTGVVADSLADQSGQGTNQSVVIVGWNPVTTNADGTAADDVAGYRVEWQVDGLVDPLHDAWQLGRDQDGGSSTGTSFGGVEAGTQINIRVLAYDRDGNASVPSAQVSILTETDATPPPVPSTPALTSRLGILVVDWDGKGSVGEAMPPDFDYVEIHVSPASNFTPSAATYYDRLYGAGSFPITDQPYGASAFVRLIAVDNVTPTANRSAPSGQASAVPSKVVSDDVFAGAIGSAQLADLAVTNAKIGLLAVNDANIGNLNVGKLTTGTFNAVLTLSGTFRTAATGQRGEWDSTSFRFFDASNNKRIELSATGTALFTGTLRSGASGTYWSMDTDGTLKHFSSGYSGFSQLYSINGDLVIRGRYDSNGRSGRINANETGVGINFSSNSEVMANPTQLQSEMVVTDRMARVIAPVIIARVDGRWSAPSGARRFTFVTTSSGGADIGASVLDYRIRSSDNRPALVGLASGIVWGSDGIAVTTSDAETFGGLGCDVLNYNTLHQHSTSDVKNIEGDARGVLDMLDVVRRARPKAYTYTHDRAGESPRFGPLMEDLPPELQIEATLPDGSRSLGVDLSRQVGVLWGAVGQICDQEIRTVAGRAQVPFGTYLGGREVELAITWDEPPLLVPTGGVATVAAAIAWLGRTTAQIKPGSLTAAGCTVVVKVLSPVVPSSAQPITVEAQGMFLWTPPYQPK